MLAGKIIRYDESRGYGFILPSAGGEDVFFHANDLGEHRHAVKVGTRVEYEVEEGDRGLKVAQLRITEPPRAESSRTESPRPESPRPESFRADPFRPDPRPDPRPDGDDDGLCDVLSPAEFRAEVTELLIEHVPSLTGAQIQAVRQTLATHARSHGWLES